MREKIVLFGYSGHSFVVNDCLSDNQFIIGYLESEAKEFNPLGIQYFGKDEDAVYLENNYLYFPAIGNNHIRSKVIKFISEKKLGETIIIHPSSVISVSAQIENSTLIGPNTTINAFSKIGEGAIVNSGAIIEHEGKIGKCAHIGPGAVLAGNVSVGENTFVGANSTVKENVTIGNNVVIAAGSVVLNNIPDNEMWAGVPAKKKKNV